MTSLGIELPSFGTPWVLFFLLIPGLLLCWTWANRWLLPSRRVVLPVDRATGGRGWFWFALIGLAECLPPLILAVGIILLAGPQKNGPPQQKRKMTNIQFAIDVSGSMMSTWGDGTLYDESMKSIIKMLDYRKGDSFGLTFFGVAYVHWVPLTTDPSAIKCAPPFMRPEIAPPAFGGTAIGNALQGCQKELVQRDEGDRMIILISDGWSYDLPEMADELGKSLEKDNITVFTIIVGGVDPQEDIVTVCRRTGGEAFAADDPEALQHIFKRIDDMKQAEFRPTFVETVDNFKPFTTAGLVLIALGTLALYGLRYTPW